MKIAITGASGFVGNRVMEKFFLLGVHDVKPLIHRHSSLSLPARFSIRWTVCDHFDLAAMTRALAGCDAVVHAAFGTPLRKMSRILYRACDKAKVRRLVILGSASVYNQNPEPGITEASPLPATSATRYNANKIAADRVFRRERTRGSTEIVFLMPGVIYGPRSQWIANLAEQVMHKRAYLIERGAGVCNAVYVDNLVEAIRLALVADRADGEAFFISDAEAVTWKDFYAPVVSAFGQTFKDVHNLAPRVFHKSIPQRLRQFAQETAETPFIERIKPHVPQTVKKVYKGALSLSSSDRPPAEPLVDVAEIPVAEDMNLLQQCKYKLPIDKAQSLLNYYPPITFAEGMSRSIAWLRFAGYPVRQGDAVAAN